MKYTAEQYLDRIENKRLNSTPLYSRKEIIDFAEKYAKQLLLHNVSNQRELLKKWWKYFDEESVAINCNEEEREEVINDFFNCG